MKRVEIIQIQKGQLQGKQISINWDYLRSGRGMLKVENVLQVIIGRVAFWLLFIIEIDIVATELIRRHSIARIIDVEGVSGLLFWVLILGILYTLYLLRDRTTFVDRTKKQNLYRLYKEVSGNKKQKPIEVSDYLNHRVIFIFDYILNNSNESILSDFLKKLLRLPRAKAVIERLGLSESDIDPSAIQISTDHQSISQSLREILIDSFIFAYEARMKYVQEEAVIFIFLKNFLSDYLKRFNITSKDFDGISLWLRNEAIKNKYVEDWQQRISIKPKSTMNRAYTSRFTPTLNQFARDFTQEVIKGDFKISIARENELTQMITILEKGDKSAVLVIGEPGVGKTTLIKSLAVRMVVEDVPRKLQDKRLVAFDFNKAFSVSKDVEEFKKKLRDVFDEVAQSGNVILVLDNVNQLLNLRQEIAGEIANIIIDSFDASKLRLIATTDRSQFIRFIRPNTALAGIFSPVEMAIPTDQVAMQIITDEVSEIEGEYSVKIAFSAIKATVELSHKFAYDRVLPDKGIDLLRETVVNFKYLAGKKPIEYDEVAKVVSKKVGVGLGTISRDESDKLSRLEEEMHKRVIDQEEAIRAVCSALRRSRSGLTDSERPIASFLFYGPTGVGKTEVAKTVASIYYGSEERMVRIDMGEYNEEGNVKRLLGFTSGRGSFEGGFLTEPVHNYPFSVVLLDEVDKANPKVLDLFLQMLDEGYLDDGLGRRVDFTNTIIIMTSNAGSSVIASLLEKNEVYESVHTKALGELKKVFRIEFLNRFDKVIMFRPLSKEQVKLVAKKFVEQVRLKLLDKGITLIYGQELLDKLQARGYNPIFGAREMRRVVQEEVEDKVAEMIVSGEVRAGGEVRM